MSNLTNIYLQANYLTELPEAIQFLTNLETLDVSQNQLSKIPHAIGKLVKLKRIILTHNQLTNLPSSLGNVKDLMSLLLSKNKLTDLPYSLHQCIHLEDLQLDFNNFTVLPNFLTRLPRLRALSVCSNQLVDLPRLPFASIQRFHCDNNPRISNLPYPLACQWNRPPTRPLATRNVLHLSCHGCFRQSSLEKANILVNNSTPLIFPSHIDLHVDSPPSLLELALRSICCRVFGKPVSTEFDEKNNLHRFQPHYHLSYDRLLSELCLPSTLVANLKDGPISFCHNCGTFIFNGPAHPVFLPKVIVQNERQGNLEEVVCSLLFCSIPCYRIAVSSTDAKLDNRLHWDHITQRAIIN